MEVERIAAPAWDAMSPKNSVVWNRTELILTFPYLMSLFVLPFMAIAFQLFSSVALVLYIVLTAYHFLAREDRKALERSVIFTYYNRRRWISLSAAVLLLITTVLFWVGISQGAITASIIIATLCLAALLLLEGVLEYVWDSGFFLL